MVTNPKCRIHAYPLTSPLALSTQTWSKVIHEPVPEFGDLGAGLLAHTLLAYVFDVKVFVLLTRTLLLFTYD